MGRHSTAEGAGVDTGHALEIAGLTMSFTTGPFGRGGRVLALDGLDLMVGSGTVHALLGPNGAGKTTTVRTVATLIRPDSGSVIVGGVDALTEPDRVREMIGVSGQYAAVDGNLTGFENLRMVAQLYGHPRREAADRARAMIAELSLTEAADRPMRTYSGGMRRRLDLAGALINEPTLIILDEPTTGLDPRGRRQIWEVIADQVGSGATVLLTTQYLEEADALADEITVIDDGRVRAQGTASALKAATTHSVLTVEITSDHAGAHDAPTVTRLLGTVGTGAPVRLDADRWSVSVPDGTRSAVEAVRVLDGAGIVVTDASVVAPTLDDVFLTLTENNAVGADGVDLPATTGADIEEAVHAG